MEGKSKTWHRDHPEVSALVRAIVAAESRVLPAYYTPDCCIAAAAITRDALRAFGVASQPWPCRAVAMNQAFARRMAMAGGRLPRSVQEREAWHREDGAHSVGIGFGGDPRPRRWDGHLATIVRVPARDVWLLDASITQASRPAHRLILSPVASDFDPFDLAEGCTVASGTAIVVYLPTTNRGYEASPDWTDPDRRAEPTALVVSLVRDLLITRQI